MTRCWSNNKNTNSAILLNNSNHSSSSLHHDAATLVIMWSCWLAVPTNRTTRASSFSWREMMASWYHDEDKNTITIFLPVEYIIVFIIISAVYCSVVWSRWLLWKRKACKWWYHRTGTSYLDCKITKLRCSWIHIISMGKRAKKQRRWLDSLDVHYLRLRLRPWSPSTIFLHFVVAIAFFESVRHFLFFSIGHTTYLYAISNSTKPKASHRASRSRIIGI